MSLPYQYTADVPQGNQQINNTQQPINYNFQDIADLLAVNHIPLNTADTFGSHNIVNYVIQSGDPATGSTDIAVYAKNVSTSAQGCELFYRYPNNGSVTQLTGTNSSTTQSNTSSTANSGSYTGGTYSNGYQYYAGTWQINQGIIIMTGSIFVPYPSTYYFNIPTGTNIPIFSTIYGTTAQVTGSGTYGNNVLTEFFMSVVSSTQLSIATSTSSSGNYTANWIAIGV